METLAVIRKPFGEENMSGTHRVQKKAREMKSKIKSMLIIFFDIKGNFFAKNSFWEAKLRILL
jgi:hypothetical protein